MRTAAHTRPLSDTHFMPQYQVVSGSSGKALHPDVLHIPIEMLSEPDGYACPGPPTPFKGSALLALAEEGVRVEFERCRSPQEMPTVRTASPAALPGRPLATRWPRAPPDQPAGGSCVIFSAVGGPRG